MSNGAEICPCTLERQTLLNSYITLLAVCMGSNNLWQSIIIFLLLDACRAVSGVFVYILACVPKSRLPTLQALLRI